MTALEITDLNVSFATESGPVQAVRQVSLAVEPGRVLALVGESGSGKSVTAMSVLGLLPSTARITGRITVAGTDLAGQSAEGLRAIRGARVGMVFQEPLTALNPSMTVGAQVAEALTNHGMARAAAARRSVELLTEVGIPQAARRASRYPHEFSGGQRQRIVIAIALACDPALLIADEPTTALDVTVQAEILDLMRRLVRERGSALLLITHNMGVVADIADEVAVMSEGRVVEHGDVRQVLTAPRDDYTRRLLAAVPTLPTLSKQPGEAASGPSRPGRAPAEDRAPVSQGDLGPERTPGEPGLHPAQQPGASSAEPVLELHDVRVEFGHGPRLVRAVNGVDLTLAPGEIVGVVGESGSGKSTLARAVLGLVPLSGGEVRALGSPLRGHGRAARALRARIGVVFQDPAGSLDPRMTVGESVAEPLVMHPGLVGRPDRAERRRRVGELLEAVRLPAGTRDRYPHELSGGQRQRVALARALALRPGLLIADEPTSALDVSVQHQVLDVLREVHRDLNFGCLFISHDLAVVHEIAGRVLVMRAGAVVEQGTAAQVLSAPQEPYAQALVSAVPSPDPIEQARRREQRRALAS